MKFRKLSLEMKKSHPIWGWYGLDEDELEKNLSEWLSKTSKGEIISHLILVSITMRKQWEESIEICKELSVLRERKTESKKLFAQMEKLRAELRKEKGKGFRDRWETYDNQRKD